MDDSPPERSEDARVVCALPRETTAYYLAVDRVDSAEQVTKVLPQP